MKSITTKIAWVVIAIAAIVMFGWFADIDILKSLVPGLVTMKFSTAFSFFISGLLLLFTEYWEEEEYEWSSIVLPNASLVLSLIMGTSLASVLLGFKSGIEGLFVREEIGAILTTVPGRPSIGAMAAFIIIAILGITSMSDSSFRFRLYHVLGFAVAALGGVALFGYVINTPALYYSLEGVSTAMALHTALLFVLIGVGYVALSKKTHAQHAA